MVVELRPRANGRAVVGSAVIPAAPLGDVTPQPPRATQTARTLTHGRSATSQRRKLPAGMTGQAPSRSARPERNNKPAKRAQTAQLRPVSSKARVEKPKPKSKPKSKPKPKPKSEAKPKPEVETQTCNYCGEQRTLSMFPDKPQTPKCDHRNDCCQVCIRRWIDTQLSMFGPGVIQCIRCRRQMSDEDIKAHAEPSTWERIQKRLARIKLSKNPDFHVCQATGCDEGQIHKDTSTPFTCGTCKQVSCVSCGGAWHKNKTCAENKAEDKTIQKTEKSFQKLHIKTCPGEGCKAKIQKHGGCDHIRCGECKTDFCWQCLHVRNGHAQHLPSCPNYQPPPPQRDHQQ